MIRNQNQLTKNNPSIHPFSNNQLKKIINNNLLSFPQNQIKSNFLRNSQKSRNKKEEKEKQNSFSSKNKDKNTFSKNAFINQIKYNENNINKIQINIDSFYKIRKEISKNLKHKYKGPYMEYLIKKGYYDNYRKEDYPIYYNYYQIFHLMNKKIFSLSLNYNEFLLIQDGQEYLMKYFDNNEQYIIMNFLLYKVYDYDKSVIADNPKKILTNKQIKEMFKQLVKNNYKFDGNMEILDNIGVYFRMNFSNAGKVILFLEKLKPVLNSKINYFYIKDIPKYLIPNCMPNIFPNLKKKYKYLDIFLRLKKYDKIKKFGLYEVEKAIKELEFIDKNKSKSIEYNKYNKYNLLNSNNNNEELIKNGIENNNYINSSNESNKPDEIFLENISLSSEEEDNTDNKDLIELSKIKNLHNENRRLLVDYDIYDYELLLNKFIQSGNVENLSRKSKKKSTRKDRKLFFNREIKRFNSINQKENNNKELHKIDENKENSLIVNKKKFILNDEKLFKKKTKEEIFKTSLKDKIDIIKKNKKKPISTQYFSKKDNKNDTKNFQHLSEKNKIDFMLIKSKNKLRISKIKRKELPSSKNKIKGLLRKTKSDISQSNIPNINIFKEKNKDLTKYQEFIRLEKLFKRNNTNLDYIKSKGMTSVGNFIENNNIESNLIDKNLKGNSYSLINQTKLCSKFKETQKFIKDISLKNLKYKVKKFCTLKEFEKIYKTTKEMGLLPKNKMFFHGDKFKAFSTFAGMNLFENKKYNEWEDKKEEIRKIKLDYLMLSLKNKIKKNEIKNKLSVKDCTGLKEILKYSNIYS